MRFRIVLVMLPCQNCGGNQKRTLLAGSDAFKGSAQCHFGFAEAYIAAEQTVHRHFAFHVVLNLVDAAQLILCFLEFKMGFEIVPILHPAESEALWCIRSA